MSEVVEDCQRILLCSICFLLKFYHEPQKIINGHYPILRVIIKELLDVSWRLSLTLLENPLETKANPETISLP